MEDDPLVEQAAGEFIGFHGASAVERLHEMADLAEDIGDTASAQDWRAIAHAAERILGS
jgi:hypothetical protein